MKEMERIWLPVPWVRLLNVAHREPFKEEEPPSLWCHLRFADAFTITRIILEKYEESPSGFSIITGNASVRLLDVPIVHPGQVYQKPLLYDLAGETLFKTCLFWRKEMEEYLSEGMGELGFPQISPWDDGKQAGFEIPVDFVRLSSPRINRENERVFCDIQVGHHLHFWSVNIFIEGDRYQIDTSRIHDEGIVAVVCSILARSEVKKVFDEASEISFINLDFKPYEAVPGCDLGAPPPTVRFIE